MMMMAELFLNKIYAVFKSSHPLGQMKRANKWQRREKNEHVYYYNECSLCTRYWTQKGNAKEYLGDGFFRNSSFI